MSEMLPCPDCDGKGENIVNLERFNKSGLRMVVCDRCDGSGLIPIDVQVMINKGARRREDRLRRGMTLRKEAERLGITPTQLSAIENGREVWRL